MASAHHPTQQQYSMPPSGEFSGRLPSIRDLNFPHTYQLPPPERGGPPNGPTQSEHNASPPNHAPRHENTPWSRAPPPPPSQAPSAHHSPNAPETKPIIHKSESAYSSQSAQYAPPAGHGVANVSQGNARGDGAPQHTSKRRAEPATNVSAGRSSHPSYQHSPYPPQQPPPPQYQHSVSSGSAPAPPPSHEPAHQPPQFVHPGPGYPPYPPPPQHMAQRPPYPGPPPSQTQQPHVPPTNSFPPPPPPEQWQQHQQAPPPHYDGYSRATPLVPSAVDGRNVVPVNDGNRSTMRQTAITEVGPGPFTLRPEHPLMIKEQIVQHCTVIYNFAHRYASLQNSMHQVQPTHEELREMHVRATTIMKLLDDLRRMASPSEPAPREAPPFNNASDDPRPPKRPWEDARHEELMPNGGSSEVSYNEEGPQTTAEQDMEIIRSKRATSTGGTAPGQPKSKYRKRSRATPPGKCHSCNIRETPEWRRGPDGARTLCNACGLHYAKLMRKREKAGADGKVPPIDLQTLRASTASARGADTNGDPNQPAPPPGHHPASQMHSAHPHQGHPPPPPPHGAPYQLVPLPPNQGPPPQHQMMHPPPPATNNHESGSISGVPPPPWMTPNNAPSRPYADPAYMRSSHQAPHSRTPPQ